MAKLFRRCIDENHWLSLRIPRRHARTKLSGYRLARAMGNLYSGRIMLIDADGVCALFALCGSTVNPIAQLNTSEVDGGDVELLHSDQDDDGYVYPDTPLSCALAFRKTEVVRFLLRRKADPNGYQRHRRNIDGTKIECVNPLFQAVNLDRPDFVGMLLQARANPDDWGYEYRVYGESIGSVEYYRSERETPLWRAVHDACQISPRSWKGRADRATVQSLLRHGAKTNDLGNCEEYHPRDYWPADYEAESRADYESEYDSDCSVEDNMTWTSIGWFESSRRRRTPLGLALSRNARSWPWSEDVVHMLLPGASDEVSWVRMAACKQHKVGEHL